MKIFLQKPSWGRVSLLRQTSQYSGITKKADYHLRKEMLPECDYILALEPVDRLALANANRNTKIVFVQMENRNIWAPSEDDLSSIDLVISPYSESIIGRSKTKHIQWFPCVPWFYGISFSTRTGLLHEPLASRIELDEMLNMKPAKKPKLLSVIVSGKEGMPGHKWRKEIATAIKGEFGSLVDIYGFGNNPIADKRMALDPYAYSVVIENSMDSFYATEKIVDCLIAWTIPIYSGSESIDDLLGVSVPRIPYGCSPDRAVAEIKRIIQRSDWSEPIIKSARAKAMHELNIFEALPNILRKS